MSLIDDAKAAAAAAQSVVAELEANPTPNNTVASESVTYDSQVITNADGSVIVTLTPTVAPAAVSEGTASESPTEEPTAASDVGPTAAGQ